MKRDCVVIGAGISGILAAMKLKEHNLDVVLLEKSRGVGGRMATRRYAGGVFDHGAQFFTIRENRLESIAQDMFENGVAAEWCRGFAKPDGTQNEDGHPRFRGIPAMNAIPKYLAAGLDIQLNTRVNQLWLDQREWVIATETGLVLSARSLVLTPPVPQSIALLGELYNRLPEGIQDSLADIGYDRCLALLAKLEGPSRVPPPGAVQIGTEPIQWIADNKVKGISPDADSLTIHAAPEFSLSHWEAQAESIAAQIFQAGSRWIDAEPSSYQLHRWRYSKPKQVYPEPFLYLAEPAPLIFAGDAFGGPRVEGAAISGISAGEFLGSILSVPI